MNAPVGLDPGRNGTTSGLLLLTGPVTYIQAGNATLKGVRLMLNPVLLSFGYDRTVLATRSTLLRKAGYSVEEVTRWSDAHNRAQSDVIDAVLICHTVPPNDQGVLVSAIRSHRRLLPIFFINCQHGHPTTIERCTPVGRDSAELWKCLRSTLSTNQNTLSARRHAA
jgi:CheY-like chemotaxis protein